MVVIHESPYLANVAMPMLDVLGIPDHSLAQVIWQRAIAQVWAVNIMDLWFPQSKQVVQRGSRILVTCAPHRKSNATRKSQFAVGVLD